MKNARFASLIFPLIMFNFSALAQVPGVFLGDLSWPEAEIRYREAPIVILPFGAGAKEHGPHMPMNADRVVMDHLLQAAVRSRNVIVTPPILHGWFPAFRDFPGTEVADPNEEGAKLLALQVRYDLGVVSLQTSPDTRQVLLDLL